MLKDCIVETFCSSKKGGQHTNRTQSAVRIVHLSTKIFSTCQKERSQYKNKLYCINNLWKKLLKHYSLPKIRIKTNIPSSQKIKRLIDKKHRSEIKEKRKKPSIEYK